MMDSLKTCEPHCLHFFSDHFHIVLQDAEALEAHPA
jgi:hypothetical protein